MRVTEVNDAGAIRVGIGQNNEVRIVGVAVPVDADCAYDEAINFRYLLVYVCRRSKCTLG